MFVIIALEEGTVVGQRELGHSIREFRKAYPRGFIAVISKEVQENPQARQICTDDYGANMVDRSTSSQHFQEALKRVFRPLARKQQHRKERRGYQCPYCGLAPLTEDELWEHVPLYHINASNRSAASFPCPVCGVLPAQQGEYFQPHLHNAHGPPGRGEGHSEYQEKAPHLYTFALVLCRRPADGKYLLVQEFGRSGYWLPGGRVDAGESLVRAAERETLEEAGVAVTIKGVLRLEYSPSYRDVARLRAIFYAEPSDETAAVEKTLPDYESVGSVWSPPHLFMSPALAISLRGDEPHVWIPYLEKGGPVFPLSTLSSEHCSVVIPSTPFFIPVPTSSSSSSALSSSSSSSSTSSSSTSSSCSTS